MKNINRVTMIGQLVADPKITELASGHMLTRFRLATNYAWKDKNGEWQRGVDFHSVVAWESVAKNVAKTFSKGDSVFVEGKLRTNTWEGDDGVKKYFTDVVARSVMPMGAAEVQDKVDALGEDAPEEMWERTDEVVVEEITA